MKKRALSLLLAVLMLVTALPLTASAANMTFTDVPESAWYYAEVKKAVEMDLINGKPGNIFAPEENLTYAEAVKLAAAMNQKFNTGNVTLVNGNPWYQSYVDYCKTAGIISKDYLWNEPASRQGYMEIFAKALPDTALPAINTIPDNSIPDVSMASSAAPGIYKLYRAGVLQGSPDYYDGKLTEHLCKPGEAIRRCEVAAILVRMMDASKRITFSMGPAEAPLAVTTDKTGTLNVAEKAEFTVKATVTGGKSPYLYQWYLSTSGAEGSYGPISGAEADTLKGSVPNAGTYYILCRVTDANGKTAESKAITVVVTAATAALAVTTDPKGTLNVTQNTASTFKAVVTGGTEPYTYQWQYSADGANWTNSFTTAEANYKFETPNITRLFRVKVTDAAKTEVVSAPITVNVGSSTLSVTINQPAVVNVKQNDPFTAKVTASGGVEPYTYQWSSSKDGSNFSDIALGKSDTLSTICTTAGTFYFVCFVTDAKGSVTGSDTVKVNVTAAAGPVTDLTITGPSSSIVGQKVTFNAKVTGGQAPYTYTWQYLAPGDKWTVAIASTDTCTLAPNTVGTWQFYCMVEDANGSAVTSNTLSVSVAAASTPLTANAAPNNVSIKGGETFTATVSASGGKAPYTYQWCVGTSSDNIYGSGWSIPANSTGSTFQHSVNMSASPNPSAYRYYYCKVTDANGDYTYSNVLTVSWTKPKELKVTITADTTSLKTGKYVTFHCSIEGGTPPYTTLKWVRNWVDNTDYGSYISEADGKTFCSYASPSAGTWWFYLDVTDSSGNMVSSNTIMVRWTD